MKVIDSRVLVEGQPSGGPTEKIGAFELPSDPSGMDTAVVLSVGEKVEGVSVGDKVYIYSGAGKEFMQDGKKLRVISSSEIIVIL